MKLETKFRISKVTPFLKGLTNSTYFPIQQMSMVGHPDFMGCVRGTFVGLELKSLDGRLGKLQEYNLKKIEDTGGIAIVADPNNWEEAAHNLSQLDKGIKNGNFKIF